MKATSILPALAVGFVIGALTGYSFTPSKKSETPPSIPEATCSDENALNTTLKNITPEEIRVYLNAQSLDEKIKKSDEILGKIMQALVAHLGFKLSTEDLNKFGQASTLAACPELPLTKSTSLSTLGGTAPSTTLPANSGNFSENLFLAEVKKAVTDEELKKAVDQLPPNPLDRIQTSNPLNANQVRALRGRFEGQIVFLKDQKVHRTTIEFEDTPGTGKNPQGTAKVVIYNEKGKAYSKGRSNGDLSGRFTGTNYSFFIELGGDYLELIYFPEPDIFMGNYYEVKNAKLSKVGNVSYRRL